MTKFEISREWQGRSYTAKVIVEGGMITVSSLGLKTVSAKVSANNEFMAGAMLQEMINFSLLSRSGEQNND